MLSTILASVAFGMSAVVIVGLIALNRLVDRSIDRHICAALDTFEGEFDLHVEEALNVAAEALPRPRSAMDDAVPTITS